MIIEKNLGEIQDINQTVKMASSSDVFICSDFNLAQLTDNHVIVGNILKHLPMTYLNTCGRLLRFVSAISRFSICVWLFIAWLVLCRVCKLWYDIAKRLKDSRKELSWWLHKGSASITQHLFDEVKNNTRV